MTSTRPKNRKVKLVGGGHRWTRERNQGSLGGSMKAEKRRIRKLEKARKGRKGKNA